MNAERNPYRKFRVAVACAVPLVLATACARTLAAPVTPAAQVPTSTAARSTPGEASVQASGIDLRITRAVATLDRAGDGRLAVTVHNAEGVTEHLDMIGAPDSGRASLEGGRHADGSLSSAGIVIQPGTSVTFGSAGGPKALFQDVHGVTPHHTLPLMLQFGVAGLVHLQARVVGR